MQPVRMPQRTPAAVMSRKFLCMQDDQRGDDQAAGSGQRRDPQGRTVAGLADAQIEAGEADAGEHRQPDAFRLVAIFGARDQPESNRGDEEAEEGNPAGHTFGEHGENRRDRRTEHGGDRRGQSHSSRRKRAIEDCQRCATRDAAGQHPGYASCRRERSMSAGSQRAHHEQAAQVHDDREQEGVGAAGGVATEKIAGAPGQDCAMP